MSGSTFLGGCLAAWLIVAATFILRRPASPPLPFVSQVRVRPGDVVLLESTKTITHQQYESLRSYLDEMEKHTGAKFAVIDGAVIRVAAVRSSE